MFALKKTIYAGACVSVSVLVCLKPCILIVHLSFSFFHFFCCFFSRHNNVDIYKKRVPNQINISGIIFVIKIRSIEVDCQLNEKKTIVDEKKNYLDRLLIVFSDYKVEFYLHRPSLFWWLQLVVTSTQNFIFMSTNFWSNCFTLFFCFVSENGQWTTLLCAFEMRMRQFLFHSCWCCVAYDEMMIIFWLMVMFHSSEIIDQIVINDPKANARFGADSMVIIFTLFVELKLVRVHVKLNSKPLIESWLRTTNNTQSHDNNH